MEKQFKIEVIMSPFRNSNSYQYFWCLLSCAGKDWCVEYADYANSYEEAWTDARNFYKKYKENSEEVQSCELCGRNYDFRKVQFCDLMGHSEVALSGGVIHMPEKPFKYCPMCGRKLTDENFRGEQDE